MTRLPFALLLLPSVAFATIFVQRPLQDQIQETPTIVRGSIGTSYSDWGSDGSSKRIYTYYQLRVSEVLKGDADPGPITIRELGGEKDGVGMQIAGAAHFSPGEDVVVFLGERNQDDSYDVHGLSSGKLNLSRRSDGAECLSGIALAEAEADGFVHPDEGGGAGSDARCSWTLTELRQAVRDPSYVPSARATAPSPTSSDLGPSPRPTVSEPAAAPQLQPSASEEHGISGGRRLWIGILALGLAGLILLRLLNPRR